MKSVFIINPNTNRKKQYRLMKEIKEHFKGETVIIEKTKGPGYAEHIAHKYALSGEEVHLFVCGGDGTLHETINGMAGAKNIVLSVVPIGRGNDFVKSFEGRTKEDFLSLDYIKEPEMVSCDLLRVDGEYAINTVSLGFDVQVAQTVNQYRKVLKGTGTAPYYAAMLKTLIHPDKKIYKIMLDETKLPEEEYMFVVFCNGKFYGGGYQPCPDAQLGDGVMDVCLIRPVSRTSVIRLAKAYEKGEHVSMDELVQLYTGSVAHLNTENQLITINLDGEIREVKNPTVELVPHMIQLAVPPKQTGE